MEQAAQLKTILEGLLVPDNAARQAAEAALEQAQKTQPSPFLLALLTLCGDWCVDELKRANGASCVDAAAEIRTMAAVLLRRKIQAHYNALDDATKTQIQRWLATSLTTPPPENEPNLARKLGDIVAAVATLDEGFSEDVKPALLNALSTNQTAGALEALVRGDFVDEGAFSTQCAPRLARLCASTDAATRRRVVAAMSRTLLALQESAHDDAIVEAYLTAALDASNEDGLLNGLEALIDLVTEVPRLFRSKASQTLT